MPQDLYGGFDLRRGDHDPRETGDFPVWGGLERPAVDARHVLDLQRDLHELGFQVTGALDGHFDRRTQWAVRELQIYARMERVAREDAASNAARYADRLSPVDTGGERYAGPVSGAVNAATRATIRHWLEQRWRCPVVIEAWSIQGGRPHTLRAANIWWHDELTNKALRVYARDFSGYYATPPGHAELIVLGDYATYLSWSGPRSVPPRHTWAEGEMLPAALAGAGLGDLTVAQRSTFKVVRAVSEVECIGFFDSLNAYDNAFVSLGPCHWTLGIVNSNRTVSDGELCAYLGYLRHAEPQAFERAVGFFGVAVDRDWVTGSGAASGKKFFNSSQRKYTGWLALEQDDGSFERLAKSEDEANCFKTWHWFYRFAMAGRTIDGYRRRMWDMARVRIRDLRTTPWVAGLSSTTGDDGIRRAAQVGDVFTSEKAMAILLRWHVRFPGHVVAKGVAGRRLGAALERARGARPELDWPTHPGAWGDAHESALVQGLRDGVAAEGDDGLAATIAYVDHWPSWAVGDNPRGYALSPEIGKLDESRGSLVFDGADLPPPPV